MLGKNQICGYSKIRELYRTSRFNGQSCFQLTSLELLLDVSIIERLVSFLKPFLVDYLDPVNDQIGVGLSQLNSVVYGNPTMDGFARTLVKMSAQIGSQHVANHFFSWTKGDPNLQ